MKKHGVILEPTKMKFESQGVLNPGCIKEGNSVHLYYRAVRWGNRSSIGYAKLDGPLDVIERHEKPLMKPTFDYESQGMEDPRIVKIDEKYYMTYVAYDGKDAKTAYAVGDTPLKLHKKGIITPQFSYKESEKWLHNSKLKESYFWFASYYKDVISQDAMLRDKDTFLFPRRINGKLMMIHRIIPDMQLVSFSKFSDLTPVFWRKYLKTLSDYVILEPLFSHESRNIGGGCPPVETEKGWVLIYHSVEGTNSGKTYHACAALLDLNNPLKVIGHMKQPLFSPTEEWERIGVVNSVVFPTGTALFGRKLYIYYGAADKRIAVLSTDIDELVEHMLKNGPKTAN